MTRPQIMVWYNQTIEREYQEKMTQEKAEWQRTANLLAMIHNTQMGIESKNDMKDAEEFMPDLEEDLSDDDLIDMAKDKGLNVPEN